MQNFASAAADGNGSNDGDYKNPEFDALCDKAAASKSVADANKLYQQAQQAQAQQQAGAQQGPQQGPQAGAKKADDNVVDADYKVVDDDKK